MKRKNRELICIIVGILLVMALLIFLYRQDSDTGRHEDNNESEPTPTVEVETEPTEAPMFGVPEGQVDADKDKLFKGDSRLTNVFKETSEGTFLRREIEHDYDEYAHIDNAIIHYYFDTWLGVVDMAKACAYQYSRDSDIWSLLSCEDSEIVDVEYNTEAIAAFDGAVLNVEKYTGYYFGGTTYYNNALTIESIDTSSYPLKVTVSYSFDTFDSAIGYLSDNTTMYMKVGSTWQIYGEHDIENSTYSSLEMRLRLLHSEEGYYYEAELSVQ